VSRSFLLSPLILTQRCAGGCREKTGCFDRDGDAGRFRTGRNRFLPDSLLSGQNHQRRLWRRSGRHGRSAFPSHRCGSAQAYPGKTDVRHRVHARGRIAQGGKLHLPGAARRADNGCDALELRAGGGARLERSALRHRQTPLSRLSDQRRALHFRDAQRGAPRQHRKTPQRHGRAHRRSVGRTQPLQHRPHLRMCSA
jgi:hypothetical protein